MNTAGGTSAECLVYKATFFTSPLFGTGWLFLWCQNAYLWAIQLAVKDLNLFRQTVEEMGQWENVVSRQNCHCHTLTGSLIWAIKDLLLVSQHPPLTSTKTQTVSNLDQWKSYYTFFLNASTSGWLTVSFLSPECSISAIADLAFLVDGSWSVGRENFKHIRSFISALAGAFDIGEDKTRVAVVQYSTDTRTEFPLTRYNRRGDLLQAINSLPYKGGNTMTGKVVITKK